MAERIMRLYNKNFPLDFISATVGIPVNAVICIVYDETVAIRVVK